MSNYSRLSLKINATSIASVLISTNTHKEKLLVLNNTPIYRIKDYKGEEITGTFYKSELQKIDIKDEELWKIELAT